VNTSRRAERFHELVEETSTSGARSPEYAELLAVVGGLRAVEAPVADPAFVATLRERLVTEAESVLAGAAASRDQTDARLRLRPTTPRTQRRRRRLAAAVSGVILVGTSATVAVAAQSALPGDGLYPVKRGLESAHAELTFDRAARGRLLLDNAGTLLGEAQELSSERADPARVSDALDSFTDQATSGADLLVADYQATGDESSMTTLRTFTADSMSRLQGLQSVVPPQALDSLLQAARALDQVQQISVQTCSGCAGPLATTAPTVLTQAAQAATASWQVVVSRPGHHNTGPGTGPGTGNGQPHLPHVPAHLPPASVTDPDQSTAGNPDLPTDGEVQHTLQHLTDGLTDNQQNDGASTVTDTATNLLDAVGQVGNTVGGVLGTTIDGVTSLLPSGLPSLP
jgi:Domain of unknown function (DUF5667)